MSNTLSRYLNSSKNMELTNTYTTRSNWSDDRTWTAKLAFPFGFDETTSGEVSLGTSFSFDRDGRVYNQYGFLCNFKLSRINRLTFDYLFVQRRDAYVIRGLLYRPDDDHVFRLTLAHTL